MALPHGDMGCSVVFDCGIYWLTHIFLIFNYLKLKKKYASDFLLKRSLISKVALNHIDKLSMRKYRMLRQWEESSSHNIY